MDKIYRESYAPKSRSVAVGSDYLISDPGLQTLGTKLHNPQEELLHFLARVP